MKRSHMIRSGMKINSATWAYIAMLLGMTVLASSCTLNLSAEKRRYRPGYHVEFSSSRKKPIPIERSTVRPVTAPVEEWTAESAVEASTGPASVMLTAGTPPERLRTVPTKNDPVRIKEVPKDRIEQQPLKEVRVVKTAERHVSRVTNSDGHDGGKSMRVLGIFFALISLIAFLLIGWQVGLIALILGMIFLITGSSDPERQQPRGTPRGPDQQWDDVVHLKNGSIIRGMIIEQVPNVSLKIRTADGNVFAYEMDQVAKTTREQPTRSDQGRSSIDRTNDRTNGMAITGFVCSFFFPLLGLIFSAIGLGQIRRRGGRGKGLAIAGLVISIITILLIIALLG